MLKIEQTPSTSPRTIGNPLFPVNYVDRMIGHRVKEQTRESNAVGRRARTTTHRWSLPDRSRQTGAS
ncbi:MAG: hypothetical protein ACOC2Y_07215 [Spirochaetota bacterium]